MSGIFGSIDVDPDVAERLVEEWQQVWPGLELRRVSRGMIGVHGSGSDRGLITASEGTWIGVDGEPALTRTVISNLEMLEVPPPGPSASRRFPSLVGGNVALLMDEPRSLELETDWSGTFPLYFGRHQGGVLFSSLLRPLARALGSIPDPVGIVQFLRTGYTCAGRTFFRRIHRLQPGQSLRVREGRVHLEETSELWCGDPLPVKDPSEAAEAVTPLLRKALARSLPDDGRSALMMSGGWDSRTLLAVASNSPEAAFDLGYSHGDLRSRELRLVRSVCSRGGLSLHLQPIDAGILDPSWLEATFPRSESVVFPHWLRAGEVLASLGLDVVSSGVFGEVLGGHYGETMLAPGGGKITSFLRSLLAPSRMRGRQAARAREAHSLFRTSGLGSPWYLRSEYLRDQQGLLEELNEATSRDLKRLERRGIEGAPALIEAFVTEHRGTQYINAQLLSCRSQLDVAIPFVDSTLLDQVTRIPLRTRLHNRVNRRIIEQTDPGLLRVPLAATLVPAGSPLLMQEGSRVIRKLYETWGWSLHRKSGGRTPPPRLGWVNFEFLRGGTPLAGITSTLRSEIWDRRGMKALVDDIRTGGWDAPLHPVFDQMGKILTVDLMLR